MLFGVAWEPNLDEPGAVKAFTVDVYPLTTTLTIESEQLKKNDAFNRTVGRFEACR